MANADPLGLVGAGTVRGAQRGIDGIMAEREKARLQAIAEEAAARREARADESLGLQRRSTERLEADAQFNRERTVAGDRKREDDETRERAEAAAAAARRAALLDEYDAAVKAGDQQTVQSIGLRMINDGLKLPPAAPRDPLADYEARKKIDRKYEKPAAGPAGPKDNPRLPTGVKTWIDSLSQRGIPIEQARAELSRGWGQQKTAHPNADLAEAAKYLTSIFPQAAAPEDPPRTGMGQPADPPSAEVEHRVYRPDVSLPAERPQPAVPPEATAAAEQALKDAGYPVTPENIAAVIQQMTGGGE